VNSELPGTGNGRGLIFVISAPSGTGKTTLVRKVMERVPDLRFSVSYTTRAPRSNERDGEDYHFVASEVFESMVKGGEFLEWAEVLGNHYGTARVNPQSLRSENVDLILDVDTQGAKRVKERMDHAVLIFVLPPSPEVLRERLVNRGLDSRETIERRLSNARREIAEAHGYDYLVVNDRMEDAVERLRAIILAERCRNRQPSAVTKRIKEWEELHGKDYRSGLPEKG
jgi:guanylate kinase